MLDVSNGANAVQVSPNVGTQYMLQQLTGDGRERDWAVVGWVTAGSFLENWRDPGLKPRRGSDTRVQRLPKQMGIHRSEFSC